MALATVQTPPSLQEAARKSTTTWQIDLESLFHHAKDRFPDVVWEVLDEDDSNNTPSQLVYGHKAIVYARAPPSFQNRYFAIRPNALSPLPFSGSPAGMLPANSAISLPLSVEYDASRSSSPFRSGSPSPSTNTAGMLRLTTSINPTLFSNELEYLYTGKGFGEAFEFLFDSTESHDDGDAEEQRIDKLRKDLVFMWRSRLYSDVRLELTGTFSSANHESSTAIFATHRFILVSRSPYFFNALSGWGGQAPGKTSEPVKLVLPSPPFTPPSLHFTLGFIYTGTLVFSHRSYDLDTAFHILRSANYLSLQTLHDEIQARIVQEMMHGLFHAFLEFSEYERITGSKWGTGGCRCRQCARRMPRILEFTLEEDVKNPHLERGARRGLVGLFGEGWCNSEFANLDQKHRDNVLRGLGKRTTPVNIFPLLFASQHALTKLSTVIDAWADIPRDMIHTARKTIFEVLCNQAEECFEQPEWLELMENDGAGFDDAEKVEHIMNAVQEGLSDKNAPMVYQVLVSSILIRPHPVENDATMLSATSHVRVQVEQTRTYVLRWIRTRWMNIRQEGAFDNLEGWAAKEISHDIDVPVEELFTPVNPPRYSKAARTETQSDVASVHSLRSTVLKGSTKRNVTPPTKQTPVASSGASIRSIARSTISTHSTNTVTSRSTIGRQKQSRPDSKLTPHSSSTSLSPGRQNGADSEQKPPTSPLSKISVSRHSTVSSRVSTVSTTNGRPKSLAPSVKSHASTVRNEGSTLRPRVSTSPRVTSSASTTTSDTSSTYKTAGASPATLRPPSSVSRSTSATSSDGSTTFKTANTEARSSIVRPRRLSSGSTASNSSIRTTGTATDRLRRTSATSATSALSTGAKPKKSPSPISPQDPSKLSPLPKSRSPSVRSTASTKSTASKTKGPVLKPAAVTEKKVPLAESSNTPPPSRAVNVLKGKEKKTGGSTVSSAPMTSTIKRKGSADTITKRPMGKSKAAAESTASKDSLSVAVQGATLEIGIPCIVSLKRKRFKAYARYIGEVEGESGPWVGIEVPMVEGSLTGKLDSRQWNDGSWGGVRYFDIGSAGSEWEFGDDRAPRRRRLETSTTSKGTKREGDTLHIDRSKRIRSVSPAPSDTSITESRGLFVRPQNVLFVMGADD